MDVDSEPAHSLNYLKMFLSKSLMEVLAIIVMMLLKETNPEPQFWRGIIGTSSRRCSRSPSGVQMATMLKWTALFTNIFSISTTILLIEGVLGSKTYLAKVARSAQKPRGRHLSRPRPPFWGPLAAILDFAGGAALQAVSERPLCR